MAAETGSIRRAPRGACARQGEAAIGGGSDLGARRPEACGRQWQTPTRDVGGHSAETAISGEAGRRGELLRPTSTAGERAGEQVLLDREVAEAVPALRDLDRAAADEIVG